MVHTSKMNPKPMLWPQQVSHPAAPLGAGWDGQGCPPLSPLTPHLHDPMGSAAAPSRRSTNLGAWSSCSIQRSAQQDEARAASAALYRKEIRCQGMGQRQPLSLHGHRGTQPSFSCGVGSTSALSHTPWPKPACKQLLKAPAVRQFKSTRPQADSWAA